MPTLRLQSLLTALVLATSVTAWASDLKKLPDADLFTTTASRVLPTAPPQGGYLLMGGSDDVDEAFRWFLSRAGHGNIVILRASGGDDYNDYLVNQLAGTNRAQTILFHNRNASQDPEVLAALRQADGIFLAGGDQALYVNYWKGTPVNTALDDHVKAGRPLGGTSAGLAILGAHSYGCLDGISLTSPDALARPDGPAVTLVDDFLHLPGLENVITDSHFSRRSRLGRLIVFVSRLQAAAPSDEITGVGIDEKTALCIEPDGTARVFSQGDGHAWFVSVPRQPLKAGEPLNAGGIVARLHGPGAVFKMPDFRAAPTRVKTYRVIAGSLEEIP